MASDAIVHDARRTPGQAWSLVEPREPFGDAVAIGAVVEGRRVLAIVEASNEAGFSTYRVFVGEVRRAPL